MAGERGERGGEGGRGLRLQAREDGGGAQPRGGVGGGAGAVGSSSEQEGVGDDGEGGERVRGAAEEARDHREGQEPDREGECEEEGDAGDDVREGEPRLRVDLLDAVAGRVGAFGAEQRERVGGFGGARGVRREGEGVAVGAERGSAQSVGVVAGVVAAAVQARADVHPGRGGRGAGPEPHAEHRAHAAEALRSESVHRGESEGGHVHERECAVPNEVRGWREHGDEDCGTGGGGGGGRGCEVFQSHYS